MYPLLRGGDNVTMKLDLAPALRASGLTQSALADLIEVKKGYVSELMSGKKEPSFAVLSRIIEVLKVTPNDVLTYDQPPSLPSFILTPMRSNGFSDGDVAPFEVRKPGGKGGGDIVDLRAIWQTLAPKVRHLSPMLAQRSIAAFSICAGDILLTDLMPEPRPGDTVLVQVYDDETGTAKTLLREFRPPVLLTREPGDDEPIIATDDPRIRIAATVATVLRAPGLSQSNAT
jgi:transcriptional regulator with XRE-family HTH domain